MRSSVVPHLRMLAPQIVYERGRALTHVMGMRIIGPNLVKSMRRADYHERRANYHPINCQHRFERCRSIGCLCGAWYG